MKYFETKKDSLEEAISKAINEKPDSSRELKESKMGAFFLDMQIDANEMSERDFIKKYQGEMGMTARELKDLYREMTESFSKMNAKDLEEKAGKYLRYSDLLLQKGRLMAKNKNTMMIDREIEKEKRKLGIKDSFDAKLDKMVKENDEYEKFFNAALKKFGVKSPADLKTTEKKKEFFNYVDNNYKAKNEDLDEDIKGFKPHVGPRDTLSYHLPKQKKSMKAFFDLVSKNPKVKNVKQETMRGRGGTVSKIDYDTDKNTQAALMRELDKLEKKFGEYAGQTNVVEELDKDDEKSVQKIADKLKKASKKHANQAKSLEKDLQDNVDKTLDRIREANVEKSKSMRSILADIWKMNEGKNPFEKKEEDEKSTKTMTGKKPTKVEVEPQIEKKEK